MRACRHSNGTISCVPPPYAYKTRSHTRADELHIIFPSCSALPRGGAGPVARGGAIERESRRGVALDAGRSSIEHRIAAFEHARAGARDPPLALRAALRSFTRASTSWARSRNDTWPMDDPAAAYKFDLLGYIRIKG